MSGTWNLLKLGRMAHVSRALLFIGALLHHTGIARADNPIVQTIYTADPAPIVHNDRMYVFTGHDEDGSTSYDLRDWRLFSSADMANWLDHGMIMNLSTFSWASERAWAGHVTERNGNFYYYVPMRNRGTRKMAIGVAVSSNITGPYRDALGRPLVENDEIDPAVFVDDDGQAYMYWGNPNLWYVKLNQDMISTSGAVTQIPLTTAGFGTRTGNPQRPTTYEEGPWVYKRNGIYYLIYAADFNPEDIRYSTGPSPTGPWTYRGLIMDKDPRTSTIHPGIVDYKNASYFVYHNGALPGGSSYTRSVAVERFDYNADGSIPKIPMTDEGPPQVGTLDPYVRQEAETTAWASGVKTEVCSEGGIAVSQISNADYIKVKGVAFGSGAKSFSARVASATSGGKIEVRLGSATGTLVGTCTVPGTGSKQVWTTVSCPVDGATGTQDLFLRFTGAGSGELFTFNWWQFAKI